MNILEVNSLSGKGLVKFEYGDEWNLEQVANITEEDQLDTEGLVKFKGQVDVVDTDQWYIEDVVEFKGQSRDRVFATDTPG